MLPSHVLTNRPSRQLQRRPQLHIPEDVDSDYPSQSLTFGAQPQQTFSEHRGEELDEFLNGLYDARLSRLKLELGLAIQQVKTFKDDSPGPLRHFASSSLPHRASSITSSENSITAPSIVVDEPHREIDPSLDRNSPTWAPPSPVALRRRRSVTTRAGDSHKLLRPFPPKSIPDRQSTSAYELDANTENSNIFSAEEIILRHSERHDPLSKKRKSEWTPRKDGSPWDAVHTLLESCASLFCPERAMPDALPPEPFSRSSPLCLDGQISDQSKYIAASGGYADVWTGSLRDQIVAIKVIGHSAISGHPLKYPNSSRLSHPNVLECLGFSYDFAPQTGHKTPALISRWMSNGTVISYIKSQINVDRTDIIMDIARGLTYLHTRRPAVIHGDLRAGNVLVSPNGTACLADFGLSRVVSESRGMTTSSEVAGSLRWMAPELLHGSGLSVQSDIWAYGMTVLEILTGTRPYSETALEASALLKIVKGELPIRPQGVSSITDEVWTLCQECWKIQPAQRPSISDVLATYLQR